MDSIHKRHHQTSKSDSRLETVVTVTVQENDTDVLSDLLEPYRMMLVSLTSKIYWFILTIKVTDWGRDWSNRFCIAIDMYVKRYYSRMMVGTTLFLSVVGFLKPRNLRNTPLNAFNDDRWCKLIVNAEYGHNVIKTLLTQRL